jgi:PAS domain S-box-containing protein
MPNLYESDRWMAIALSRDGLITAISGSTEKLTGYPAEELIAKAVTSIVAESAQRSAEDMLQAAEERGSWSGEILLRDCAGNELPARATMTLLEGPGPSSVRFLLISVLDSPGADDTAGIPTRDISVRLREIAHELNNPLAVTMGLIQLLLMDGCCDARVRIDLERIYSELGRMSRMVENIYAYALSLSHSSAVTVCG